MSFAAVFAPHEVFEELAFNHKLLEEQAVAEFGKRFVSCECPETIELKNGDGEESRFMPGGSIDERGMGLYLTAEIGEDGKAFLPDADDVLKRWITIIEKHDPNGKTADQQAQQAQEAKEAEFEALQASVANWDKLGVEAQAETMKGVMATLVELKANDKSA